MEKRLEAFRLSGRTLDVAPLPESQRSSLFDDFVDQEGYQELSHQDLQQEKKKRRFDRLLLSIEIVAILGLVYVLFYGVTIIQDLNQQVSEALIQSPFTPTPAIRAVVLPSGHTPPTNEGGASFNEAKIPGAEGRCTNRMPAPRHQSAAQKARFRSKSPRLEWMPQS